MHSDYNFNWKPMNNAQGHRVIAVDRLVILTLWQWMTPDGSINISQILFVYFLNFPITTHLNKEIFGMTIANKILEDMLYTLALYSVIMENGHKNIALKYFTSIILSRVPYENHALLYVKNVIHFYDEKCIHTKSHFIILCHIVNEFLKIS